MLYLFSESERWIDNFFNFFMAVHNHWKLEMLVRKSVLYKVSLLNLNTHECEMFRIKVKVVPKVLKNDFVFFWKCCKIFARNAKAKALKFNFFQALKSFSRILIISTLNVALYKHTLLEAIHLWSTWWMMEYLHTYLQWNRLFVSSLHIHGNLPIWEVFAHKQLQRTPEESVFSQVLPFAFQNFVTYCHLWFALCQWTAVDFSPIPIFESGIP